MPHALRSLVLNIINDLKEDLSIEMNEVVIMLHEIGQAQKVKYHMLSHL
jgi:hypothetical protein